MIPIVFFPVTGVDNITSAILFLAFLFFMLNFTFNGAEGIGQTYFLALVPTEKMVDIGILYFFIYGIAGAGGSFLAGLFLDIFSAVGVSSFISFKILFAVLIVLTIIALILQKGLKSLGSLSLKSALEVIFSFRDLRAISLLDKLNKAHDSQEEAILLGALHNTPSKLATDGLLERTRSPRFVTRMEAIMALEKLDSLNENAKKALMDDIEKNHYTTAYISARILGNHRCTAAIPQFRGLAFSGDYMLACEAILALAKMGDESFRPKTERLLLDAENPRLKITCAEALGIYKSPSSLTVLLDSLRGEDPPPYLRDEIILAMSAILDTDRNFYPVFVRYSADNSLAGALGTDEAEAAYENYKSSFGDRKKLPETAIDLAAKKIHGAVAGYIKNKEGNDLSKWIFELPDDLCGAEIRDVLSGAVLDDVLNAHNRLRLLIVHWAAWQLRNWTTMARSQG
jgi:HEAT repeat protein